MARNKTIGEVQDQILGGFNREIRSAERAERYGKTQLTAVEQSILAGKERTAKLKAEKKEEERHFVPGSAGYYGKDYTEVDGKLVKVTNSNK